jgi:hypothetical protein
MALTFDRLFGGRLFRRLGSRTELQSAASVALDQPEQIPVAHALTDGALTVSDVATEDRLLENHPLAAVAGTFGGPAWEELREIVERNRRKGR